MNSPLSQVAASPVLAPGVVADPSQHSEQYLVFSLADELYAINILCIREIIECAEMTWMPMMPDAVRGVINLRGAVVPVIDLSVRFGRAQTRILSRTCIVIVEVVGTRGRQVIGILVDSVNEVVEIGDIEEPPAIGMSLRVEFIHGIARRGNRFVSVLDAGSVLSIANIAARPLQAPADAEPSVDLAMADIAAAPAAP